MFQKVCETATCLVMEQVRLHRVVPSAESTGLTGSRETGSLVLID